MTDTSYVNFLEYRPQLVYKKDLVSKLKSTLVQSGVPSGALDDFVDISRIQEFMARFAKSSYQPSQALYDMISQTRSDAVAMLYTARTNLALLTDKLRKDLLTKVAKGPQAEEYIKARAVEDLNKMYAFEDYHALNMDGSTKAEVLPLLLNLQDEATELLKIANINLYGNALNTQAINTTDLNTKEMQRVEQLILLDKAGKLDTVALTSENHLVNFLYERADMMNNFTYYISDVVNQTLPSSTVTTLNRFTSFTPSPVQQDVTAAQFGLPTSKKDLQLAALDTIQAANKALFEDNADNSVDAKTRMDRLMDLSYKQVLIADWMSAQQKKNDNRVLLDWMNQVAPNNVIDPLNIALHTIMDGIDSVNDKATSLTKDLYRVIEMEQMQLTDYLASVDQKEKARQTQTVINTLYTQVNNS